MFVDVHSHIAFADYDADRAKIIDRMKAENVSLLIHPGTGVQTSKDAIALAEQYDFIYANVGLHPTDCYDTTDADLAELEKLSHHSKVVAIGEIGLDFHYPETDIKKQETLFREMLRLAKRRDLPVVIHARDAWEDMFRILEDEKSDNLRGIMHCFSGTLAEAERSLKLNFKISIPGIITFKKSNLPEVVAALRLEDLLTETDAPYLAPMPHRGKRNEPAFVPIVTQKIAEVKNQPVEEVAEQILKNAKALFDV
jgi:TatD DNase family protein